MEMKKTYKQPSAKAIDFHYDEQVVADSQQIGQEQKHNEVYCHYQMDTGCTSVVHKNSSFCDATLWSLRGL